MRTLLPRNLLLLTAIIAWAHAAAAQRTGVSLTLAAGKMAATGGDYYGREGFAISANIAGPLAHLPLGLVTAGISGSIQGNPEAGVDDCLLLPGQSGCRVLFPMFAGVALETGWSLARLRSAWFIEPRLGAGPYWADGDGPFLGTVAQFGIGRWLGQRWAVELAGHATALPSVHGHTVGIGSVMLGFRWRPSTKQ